MNLSIYNTHSGRMQPWPREVYDAFKAVRSTDLKKLTDVHGPRAYYWDVIDGRYRKKPSRSQVVGHCYHAWVLEDRRVFHVCEHHGASKDGKAERAAAEAAGLEIVTQAEFEDMNNWRDGLMRNPRVRQIIEGPRFPESAIRFKKRVGDRDVDCKSLPDILGCDAWIYELKTDEAKSIEDFGWSVLKWRYDFQAQFQIEARASLDGMEDVVMSHSWIVQCKDAPYYTYIVDASREWLREGQKSLDAAFEKLVRCLDDQELIEAHGGDIIEAWPDPDEAQQDRVLVPDDRQLMRLGANANEW